MVRIIAVSAALVCAVLTGGCADLMQQSYISQIAPDWFEAKAQEVKGAGYPELADIPVARPVEGTAADWDAKAVTIKGEAAALEAKLRADGAIRSDEEVRATAAQWRATLEEGAAAAGHPVTPETPPPAPTP